MKNKNPVHGQGESLLERVALMGGGLKKKALPTNIANGTNKRIVVGP
jgi:hypothetical protein